MVEKFIKRCPSFYKKEATFESARLIKKHDLRCDIDFYKTPETYGDIVCGISCNSPNIMIDCDILKK